MLDEIFIFKKVIRKKIMGKYRMREPWGYQDENGYQGSRDMFDNILDSFFADAVYDNESNIVQFYNKDGEKVAYVDLSDLKTQDLIEKAEYEDGFIVLSFSNGDVINIDVQKLLDENEFSDGLQVIGGVVSVKVDPSSEEYLTVSENGIKLSGINDLLQAEKIGYDRSEAIKNVKQALEDLYARLTAADTAIDGKADKEHTHTVEDITDIDLDSESGVVLGKEKVDGTVFLGAGEF